MATTLRTFGNGRFADVLVNGQRIGTVDKTADGRWQPVPLSRQAWAHPQTPTFRLRREAVAFLVEDRAL